MHTLNVDYPMKVSSIKCKLNHSISTMVICESYMFESSVRKDMKKNSNDKRRIQMYLLAYLLTLIVKEIKIRVEQGTVVTTLNIFKHYISNLV